MGTDSTQPLPLAGHRVFRTSDPEAARAEASRVLFPHRLRPNEGEFDAVLHSAAVGAVRVSVLAYGAGVEMAVEPNGGYLVAHPVAGRAVFHFGPEEVAVAPGTAAVASPGAELRIDWEPGCAMTIVGVERAALDAEFESWTAEAPDPPLRFARGVDAWERPAAGWLAAVDHLIEDLDSPAPLLRHPAALAAAERGLLTGLLLALPHNYSERLWDGGSPPGPDWMRRAADLLERLPHRNWTVAELARHANTSTRALHAGFRKRLGTTPMEYLRGVRLQRAKDRLRAADPGEGATVTAIAIQLGFTNLGRFAADYRRRFGEPPSTTLQRRADR